MHGSLCLIVQKFIQTSFGENDWLQVLEMSGLPGLKFSPLQHYPDETLMSIVQATCEHLSIAQDTALEQVGKFAAKELIRLANRMLHPEWKTFEILSNLESLIHRTIRLGDPNARPAEIQCHRVSEFQFQVVYSSRRGLCSLAKGILTGMGDVFSERLEVTELACCKRGDAFCVFTVQASESPAEHGAEVTEAAHSEIKSLFIDTDSKNTTVAGSASRIDQTASLSSNVDTPTIVLHSGSSEPEPRSTRPEDWTKLLPAMVGRYRIVKPVSAGGMGVVFSGIDEDLGRPVAIKTLKSRDVVDASLRMFLAEARQLARLNHPNVVKIFDVGRIGRRPFFVMEWLEGITLAQKLNSGSKLTLELAKKLFVQILEATDAVHRIGLVHRDIKPANIMMSPDGTSCSLLDFGLAVESSSPNISTVSGTLGYLAPERLRGLPGDYRSDFFSLGVVGLELFTPMAATPFAEKLNIFDNFLEKAELTPEWNGLDKNLQCLLAGLLSNAPDKRLCDIATIKFWL